MNISFNFLSRFQHWWHQLEFPGKRRLFGVAGGTLVTAIGLDVFFVPLTPIATSLLIPHWRSGNDQTEYSYTVSVDDLVENDLPKLGRLLTTKERKRILAALQQPEDFPVGFVPGPELPLMILHDTAGMLSREGLESRPQYKQSPLGDGIAAYVPREGQPIFTRPVLFTPYRPTATAFERAFDLGSEQRRNQRLRQVWRLSNENAKTQALKAVIDSLDDPPADLNQRAKTWFNIGSDRAFAAQFARSPRTLDGGKSTAIWVIADLCQTLMNNPDQLNVAALSGKAEQLHQVCKTVNPQLQTSKNRLARSMNVELVQKEGSDCFVSTAQVQAYNRIADGAHQIAGEQVTPLAIYGQDAYSDSQYDALTQLYLWAALYAGRYPKLVTHYWLDQGNGQTIGSHCDPRGLDLNRVYRQIASVFNHPGDSVYGIVPQYGRNPEQGDNVWWADNIMGGSAPTRSASMF